MNSSEFDLALLVERVRTELHIRRWNMLGLSPWTPNTVTWDEAKKELREMLVHLRAPMPDRPCGPNEHSRRGAGRDDKSMCAGAG